MRIGGRNASRAAISRSDDRTASAAAPAAPRSHHGTALRAASTPRFTAIAAETSAASRPLPCMTARCSAIGQAQARATRSAFIGPAETMDCGATACSRTSNRFVHGARTPVLTSYQDAVEPHGVQPAGHELPRDHARDPRNVAHRPEVAPPRALRVQGGDRHRAARNTEARGSDQHLALEHEPAGGSALHLDALKDGGRIDAEPRLAVLERLPRRPADEEIGGAIRDIARAGGGFPPEPACADDDLAGIS